NSTTQSIQIIGTTPEISSGVGSQEREILHQVGLRSTPQRLAIVHEVLTRNHPTVGEIYQSVRRRFPTIGLQTVYNTLHTMTERGLVTELPFASATRFDSNMRPHANLVCRGCGRIEDAEFVPDHLATTLRRV